MTRSSAIPVDDEINRVIGENIHRMRIVRNVEISSLAQHLGYQFPQYLYRIERGEVNITVQTLLAISEALDTKPSELLKNAWKKPF